MAPMAAIPHADELVGRIQALFGGPSAHDDVVPLVAGSPYAEPGDSKPFDVDIPGFGTQPAAPKDAAMAWLDTPNPTFGGLCPRLFVNGTDQQRAFLAAVLSSLEDGAFS